MRTDAVDMLTREIDQGRARLVAGAADLPAAEATMWAEGALAEIDAALALIEPISARVQRVWSDRRMTLPARQQDAEALIHELHDTVSAHLARAERTIADIAAQLQEGISPPRPEGVSDARELDRKHDLEALIKRDPSLERITALMTEAIVEHDALTAYCLTPDGPLSWVYKLLGLDRPRLRSALFRAVREARREPIPGEQLLRMYEAPHTDEASWVAFTTAVGSLVGCVGSQAAALYQREAQLSPGWGVPSEAQRIEQQRVAAAAMQGTMVKAPEAENLRMRMGAPEDLTPLLQATAAPREGRLS